MADGAMGAGAAGYDTMIGIALEKGSVSTFKNLCQRLRTEWRLDALVSPTQGVTPGIATVLVGADPASQLYVSMKHKQSVQIGMNSIQRELPADATQAQV